MPTTSRSNSVVEAARSNSTVEPREIVTKKLTNKLDVVVEDNLIGFVASHPHLRILQGYRVVVRADVEEFKQSRRVAIICGGGSGHEPVFAGFVGEGALTAAVAGSVFTSPPPSQIFAAMQTVQNSVGTLVFVINYTGDRMNFGLAMERAQAMPHAPRMRMVTLGEDTALASTDQSAGRRGLAGCLVVIKIAGALSEAGKSVEEIADVAEDVSRNLGTIGMSLSSCSLPGRGPIFHLGEEEMELGLGVHGEPGVLRMNLQSAKETVGTMLGHMTNPESATHLELKPDDQVVLLLNNLGGLTQLEMNILAKEVFLWLGKHNVVVKRVYSGTLMTSLEMQGCSITLLRLNPLKCDVLPLLDAPTNCAGWPKQMRIPACGSYDILPEMPCPASVPQSADGSLKVPHQEDYAEITSEGANLLHRCVQSACGMMVLHEEDLNSLDKAAGDGDTGTTMKHGAKAIVDPLVEGKLCTTRPGVLFQQMSQLWENATGGTSGCLYAIMMATMGKALKSKVDKAEWIKGMEEAIQAVQRYGKARAGDRTLVCLAKSNPKYQHLQLDALIPAVQASSDGDLKAMVEAAEKGAEATVSMPANAGRASYVAVEQLTHPDPGAQAVAMWLRGVESVFEC